VVIVRAPLSAEDPAPWVDWGRFGSTVRAILRFPAFTAKFVQNSEKA
jgi:hypothetical protein